MNADVDGYVTQLPAEGLKMVFILIYFFKKQYIISEIYYHINSADIIKMQCNTIWYQHLFPGNPHGRIEKIPKFRYAISFGFLYSRSNFSDLPICEQRIVLLRVPEIVHALFTSKKEKIKK